MRLVMSNFWANCEHFQQLGRKLKKDSFSLKNNGLASCRKAKPLYNSLRSGGVAEWSKAAVLKTVECNSS
jgi:hypothetical protein